MRRLGSVQQKIQCVFVTEVKEETSRKREGQVSPAADTAQQVRSDNLTVYANNDHCARVSAHLVSKTYHSDDFVLVNQ